MNIDELIWDEWNINHIARHKVTPEDVEEVCRSNYVIRATYNRRIMLIGPTKAGRMLTVILADKREGVYYVVSARPADRKERRIYEAEQRRR